MAPRRRRGAASDTPPEDNASETEALKNRPPNTAFRQQRMRAWQCVLTPKLIVTIFSILAAIYLGFGAYLTYLAHTVRDLRIDYTDCVAKAPKDKAAPIPEDMITAHFSTSENTTLNPFQAEWQQVEREFPIHNYTANRTVCQIQFNIPEDLKPTVNFYYYLENFYQNHRRYVGSFNAKQLLGDAVDGSTINGSTCDPVAHDPLGSGKIVYPCGIVANSMFNDTFSNPVLLNPAGTNEDSRVYAMTNSTGITWPGLRDLYGPTKYNLSQIVPPPNWYEQYKFGYTDNWMMLAASPNFYKLYQRNDKDPMVAGRYSVEIVSNFDTIAYNGRKSFLITTVSTMGSRNIWPGIIFLIVGGICLFLDIYFILSFFLWKPRKLGDPSYLSWNQPGTAAAPGTHAASA
ncbi:ligand-effect modulator 3 family [Lasiosphaeris hirsuta]|uniref:Ligand-effect modulator 3 family n=1 Tax=Lasiosphaeris hirsuta TaxID=260670 RepID=A0AA40DYN9_9PEZI|nr:ligand-effect modulator 3 family [Lasiosphaeris hirsuta]